MCRAVFYSIDNFHGTDAAYSRASQYGKGYFVVAVDDGDELGLKLVADIPSRFIVIDIPNVSINVFKPYTLPAYAAISNIPEPTRVRQFRLDPAEVDAIVASGGYATMTEGQLNGFLQDMGA